MTEPLAPTPTALAAEIITIPPEQLQAWIAEHLAHMSVAVIDELRAYCTPPALQANLRWADIASRAALAIAERLPHEPLAAGSANWARGNWAAFAVPKDAAVHYRCAAELYQQTDEHVIVARLYTNLVFVQTDQGEFDDALVSYKQAQPVLQALGEEGTFFGLRLEQNYGWLLHNQRRYADALQVYETSLALAQRLDEPVIALEIQVNRAVTRGEQGFVTEAIATLLAQREQAEQLSQELTIPRIDMILGEVFAILGRVAEGLRRFELARVGFSAQDAPMELGSILIGKAMLFERIGALKEARHNYETARVHFLEHEMWPQVGLALVQGATALRLYRTSDSLKLAAAWLDEAEAIWMARDEGEWLRQIEIERAALALVEKNADHALTLLSAKIEQQPLLDA